MNTATTTIETISGDAIFTALDAIDAGASADEAFEAASVADALDAEVEPCADADPMDRPGTRPSGVAYVMEWGEAFPITVAPEAGAVIVHFRRLGREVEGHLRRSGDCWAAYSAPSHVGPQGFLGVFSTVVEAVRAVGIASVRCPSLIR